MREVRMASTYLVVSDLHLSDVEDHTDGWKIYKSPRFVFDEDFASLLQHFLQRTRGAKTRTLILNGDIFDFDLVTAVPSRPSWPLSLFERERGLEATEPKSVWKLERILAHHRGFVAALAELCLEGGRIVYVLGNHDREFHFSQVQRALVAALEAHAARRGGRLSEGAVRFEPWFYYVPHEIYAEHGNQLDPYSSYRDVLSPTFDGREGPAIAVPMANLTNRYMGARMGFFNPHSSDFILNFLHYVRHWLKFYAFSRRSLVVSYLFGSLIVVTRLLETKKKQLRFRRDEAAAVQLGRRYNLSLTTIDALTRLHKSPIANRLYRVLREFWIDRLLLVLALAGGALALSLSASPLWAKLLLPALAFPAVYFVYEWLARGDTVFTVEQEIPRAARKISTLLPVPLVTFGHTHRPRLLPFGEGVTFVDTGAWAPITDREQRTRLARGYRNFLIATFSEGEMGLTFDCWPARSAAANQDAEAREISKRAAG
jgi:UDP-2,3-diacylglucosamine pyrophosphatase LpxH